MKRNAQFPPTAEDEDGEADDEGDVRGEFAQVPGLGIVFQQDRADLLHGHDDKGENNADGASGAHVLVDEGLAQHEERGNGGGAAGAAVHVAAERDDHAGVLERADDDEDEHEVDRADDEGGLDLGELGPPAHAVDVGGLVDVLGDVLELGEVGEHGEGTDPGEAPDDAGDDDEMGIAEPGGAGTLNEDATPMEPGVQVTEDAEKAGPIEELVEVALGGLEEKGAPDERDDQAGSDHGDDEEQPVDVLHLFTATAVDPDGDGDGRDHLEDVPQADDEGDVERLPEVGRREQVGEILQADVFGDVATVPAVEAVEDAVGGGDILEEDDEEHRRKEEEVDLPVVLDLPPADFLNTHDLFGGG
jgi:hypothetical protein